jgi:DNA-binding transcriptional ArsR family regulator
MPDEIGKNQNDKVVPNTCPKYLTPLRREILFALRENEAGMSSRDIALRLNKTQEATKKHLQRLGKMGLIYSIRGIPTIYKINLKATLSLEAMSWDNLSLGSKLVPYAQGIGKGTHSLGTSVRAHALLFKVNYSGNFNSSLFKDNPEFHDIRTEAKLKNVPVGISGRFKGEYFMINPHTITLQPHAIYGEPEATGFTLFKLAVNFFEILQENHKEIKIDKSIIVLNSQEYAFEKDIFAKLIYKLAGQVIFPRWKVDCSPGKDGTKQPELEFYGKHANDDASAQVQNADDLFSGRIFNEVKRIADIKEKQYSEEKQKQAHYTRKHPKLLRLIQFMQHSDRLTDEAIPTDPKKPTENLTLLEEIQKQKICRFVNSEYNSDITPEQLDEYERGK